MVFQILFDIDLKREFYFDLNKILKNAKYKIIGAGVDKEKYIKKYGKGAKDPYALSLSFIIERLIFCLDSYDKNGTIDVKVEKRGRREDEMLNAHYNSILDLGTYYVKSKKIDEKIQNFKFCSKRDNIIGLQIADLSAYPLARHLINPKEPYIPFDIIEEKIYCDKKGKYEGWGLKLFP